MTRAEKLQALAEIKDPSLGVLSHIQMLKGEKGDQGIEGKPGKDGTHGIDGADGDPGKDGTEGKQGPQGLRGPQGDPGKDGLNGKDGKDGINGVAPSVETIIETVLKELTSGKKLTVDHIDGLTGGLAQLKEFLKAGGYRGGGDTVVAGVNTSITIDVNGHKVINATAGGALTIISVTGTIDDSNVTFTAATLPTLLNINGAFYQQTGGAYTWTYVGTTITLNAAVGAGGSIFGV